MKENGARPYIDWQNVREFMINDQNKSEEEQDEQIDQNHKKKIINMVRTYLTENHRTTFGQAIMSQEAKEELFDHIYYYLISENVPLFENLSLREFVHIVVDELAGLGPLEPLMKNDHIMEIMVNGPNEVYVDENGQLKLIPDIKFESEEHLQLIARKILNAARATVSLSKPTVDARLPESRIQVTIPPVARNGTTITIRKFPPLNLTEERMVASGMMTWDMLDLLKVLIQGGANMVICGSTGAGKTTLIKRLAEYIPEDARILTIEDTEEMRLKNLYPQKHIVSMECRLTDKEETTIDMGKLLKSALRQRPDRILVGEVRGPEAFIMLEALNTGHSGGLTSLHANNAKDAVKRLVQMTLRAGLQLSSEIIGQIVSDTIDIVIFQQRLPNGKRVIREIVEVLGYKDGKASFSRFLSTLSRKYPTMNSVVTIVEHKMGILVSI